MAKARAFLQGAEDIRELLREGDADTRGIEFLLKTFVGWGFMPPSAQRADSPRGLKALRKADKPCARFPRAQGVPWARLRLRGENRPKRQPLVGCPRSASAGPQAT